MMNNASPRPTTLTRQPRLIHGSLLMALLALSVPVQAASQEDTPRLRREYFTYQRAYPFSRIPEGALQAARAQEAARWPNLFAPTSGMASTWTPIGPAQILGGGLSATGRAVAIGVHPTDSNIIYIGGAQGGVWKTLDGGASWTPLTDTQCSLAMGGIAIDPVNPDIVYAGTGEQHFSGDSYYGCGVLRSTDGGTTWTQLGASIFDTNAGGATISRVVIDPRTAGNATTSTVLVASSFGLYRSTDGGGSWTRVLNMLATDVVVDSTTNPSTMYAAGSFTNDGIHKSTDGGVTWTRLAIGLPAIDLFRVHLSIAPSMPSTIYAALISRADNRNLHGLFKTTDSGATWSQIAAAGASCSPQCWYDLTLAVKPDDPNTVFFGGVRLSKSIDGGASFVVISGPIHVDQHFLTFDPQDANTVLAGNDGGIYKSIDAGTNWTTLNTDLALTQFYRGISLHPTDADVVLGGTQDNGTMVSPTGGGLNWPRVLGGDGGYTAIDFLDPTVRYAETQWTQSSGFAGPRRSDGGGSFFRKVNGIDISDRALFIPPLVMDPTIPEILYFGTFRLYRTLDRGESWTALTGDLTGGGGRVSAIAAAPSTSEVIYVATSDGRVHVSTDDGATFALRNSGLPPRFFTDLAIHPTDPMTALVAVSGFGTSHLFGTTNGGVSWQNVSSNLPDVPVNAVLYDPATTSTIYVGTDLGVYRTTSGGASWAPFNDGLPLNAVFDLAAEPNTGVLVAASHGRSMFKTDIAAPLSMRVAPDARAASADFGSAAVADSAVLKVVGTGANGTAYTATTGGSSWLNLTNASGAGSTRLRWTLDPSGLVPATYTDTITVTVAGASGSPAKIVVSFTVNVTIDLAVNPGSRADTVEVGSTTPVPDSASVLLTGSGGPTQPWTATHTTAAWLTLTMASGTGPGTVQWSRDPTGLPTGVHVDTITITSTGAGGSPASIIDTLVVQDPVSVAVTPTSRSTAVALGTATAVPDSSDVVMSGFGSASQAWSAAHTSAAWVTLTTSTGSGSGPVRWSRDPSGLATGTYVDTIRVTSAGASGSPAEVVDTLIVGGAATLSLDAAEKADTTVEGSTTPSPDSITVTLAGVGSETGTWTATHGSAPWLTLTTSSGTGSGTLRWDVDPSGLSAGTFADTVVVSETAGSVDTLTVTLLLAAPISLTDAVNHLLVGSALTALEERVLDTTGNADGTYNLGDVLAWLDRCNSPTPEGCIASQVEIERASTTLEGIGRDPESGRRR